MSGVSVAAAAHKGSLLGMRRQLYCTAAVALGLMAFPAWAQTNPEVETVVVTGAKLPEPVGNAAFSVVNLDQTALSQFDQLDASLEQVPGLSLFRRSTSQSSNPTTDGVSLRSIAPSGAGRALVLLDGVPLNDPFGNWVIWGALPYESIGSAEIERGAGSGPYGAGALTGTILLSERDFVDGISQADASAGNLGTYRVGASGGTAIGKVDLFGSVDGERSNGWIPVLPSQQGAADTHTWLDDGAATLRAQTQFDDVIATARIGYYDQALGAGLQGAESKARGETASLTLADPVTPSSIGWRVQGWVIDSNLSNTSVSVLTNQSVATPANDQYAIPAIGFGFNAAALGTMGDFRWEVGGDLRDNSGESREDYMFNGTKFTSGRRSGGQLFVGGLYAEGAYDTGKWLFTAGVRADYWADSQGHLVQTTLATGAVTLSDDYPGRDGTVPTARVGARYNFSNDEYLRVTAYSGFRPASLNELYRPFRVGNVVTNANAGLVPEELYGVEAGWGGALGSFSWDATGFVNQLHNAVENATTSVTLFPPLTTQQRDNVGDINALGLEADAAEKLTDTLSLRAAISLTDARVDPSAGAIAAHPFLAGLQGKRPAEAPTTTITGGAFWQALDKLALSAEVHWDSARFENDLNTLRLGSAFVLDLRAEYEIRDHISVFAGVDNVAGANIATAETTGVVNYGEPRVYEIGLKYAQ
jgi:outer membrane receptor protein involved in Fe transport